MGVILKRLSDCLAALVFYFVAVEHKLQKSQRATRQASTSVVVFVAPQRAIPRGPVCEAITTATEKRVGQDASSMISDVIVREV